MEGNWDEARLVPHVAGILIHAMFGMAVEYVRDGENGTGTNASRMYDMLANDEADLALTLWPAKFLKTDRLAALSASCEKSLSERCVATVGNQGYKARSGWFVTAKVSAVMGKEAEWSTVVSLYDQNHTENLTKARPRPPYNPEVALTRDPDPRPPATLGCVTATDSHAPCFQPTGVPTPDQEFVRVCTRRRSYIRRQV